MELCGRECLGVLVLKFLPAPAHFVGLLTRSRSGLDSPAAAGLSIFFSTGDTYGVRPNARRLARNAIHESRSSLRIGDDLGGAEHGSQKLHGDAAVDNPEKHGRDAENERQQAVGRGRLESAEDEPDGGD